MHATIGCLVYKRVRRFKNKYVLVSACPLSAQGNFWEFSDEVLKRIEENYYIENKEKHNEYNKLHPFVFMKNFIYIY